MSALVTSAAFVVLVEVKGDAPIAHYVVKGGVRDDPKGKAALCGAVGPLDRFARPRWRRVRRYGAICNACHAEACARPTRVDFS